MLGQLSVRDGGVGGGVLVAGAGPVGAKRWRGADRAGGWGGR